jgi:hypothetical protein
MLISDYSVNDFNYERQWRNVAQNLMVSFYWLIIVTMLELIDEKLLSDKTIEKRENQFISHITIYILWISFVSVVDFLSLK